MDKTENIGAKVALINGMTFGLGFLFIITFIGILFSDGLLGLIGIGALLSYNYLFISLALLYLTLPIALWIFGKRNTKSLNQGKSIIKTSAEFSFGVNLIIWIVFLFSQLLLGGLENYLYLNLIVIGIIIVLGFLTTYTFGFYIVKLTKEKIKANAQHRL
ncbi:hypothetical protein C1T31_12000 [Hanstruepera neustonica]|uniref:Uncharacterized protein n=1 Tax=Hanstruepera neustonica TaxID=1445657 RepID=A0A2K1DWU7_9FLAO|nr:hypothetical protein [Hanstruepera neustonica]PNQ72502.1 hypothetical protein C1T31_12000 [Hanstruepera neustonica]